MNLGLLLGLLVITTLVVFMITRLKHQLPRPTTGDAMIFGGLVMTGVACTALMISMFPFQEAMDVNQFTLFVWVLINAALTGIFWYSTELYDDRQRRQRQLVYQHDTD